MTCTAIITEDGIDQIVEHAEPSYKAIIRREVRDLRAMGCAVKTKIFDNEAAAYDWAEARNGKF